METALPHPFSASDAPLLERAAEILRTVAHPVRLQIIGFLAEGEKPVNDLSHLLRTNQPYTSQQLALMKARGIVNARRDGNQVFYSLALRNIVKIITCIREQAEAEGFGVDDEAGTTEGVEVVES